MKTPEPTQYGLSDKAVAAYDQFDDRTLPRLGAHALRLGAVSGFLLGVWQGLPAVGSALILGVLYALGTFSGLLLPVMLLSVSWSAVGGLFFPAIRNYWRYKKAQAQHKDWELRTKADFWQALGGRAFEAELAHLFEQAGYSVRLTPPSGDKGIDIVLRRDGRTTVVQCKATRKPIGPAVARELYGTLLSSGADDAILATVGGLTTGAQEFLHGKAVHVMTLTEIMSLQHDPAAYTERRRILREVFQQH